MEIQNIKFRDREEFNAFIYFLTATQKLPSHWIKSAISVSVIRDLRLF